MFGKIFFFHLDSLLAFSQWKYTGTWLKVGNISWLPENSNALEMDIPPLTPCRGCKKGSQGFDLRTPCRNLQMGKIFHQEKQNTFPTKWNHWLSSMSWSHNQQHMVLDSVAHSSVPALGMLTNLDWTCRIGQAGLRAPPKLFQLHTSMSTWNCVRSSRCISHPLHTEQIVLLQTRSSQEGCQDLDVPSPCPSGAYEPVGFGFWFGAADHSCLGNRSQQSSIIFPEEKTAAVREAKLH